MTEAQDVVDPYAGLPRPVVTDLERFAKGASTITAATAISIFIPVGFLFVFAFGVLRVIQTRHLVKQFPELASPMDHFPGKQKSEVKTIAQRHENLKKVLEFTQARRAYWVAAVFPVALIAGVVLVVSIAS